MIFCSKPRGAPGGIFRHTGRRGFSAFRHIAPAVALALLIGAGTAAAQSHSPSGPEPEPIWRWAENPFSGDPQRIREGRGLYRRTCTVCHGRRGGRGPNLAETPLRGHDFMKVVMRGRKGTQMPAWRTKLTEEQVWKIMAYLGR